MTALDKLKELGLTLPPPPAGVAAYEPWVRTGNLIVTSGQLPWHQGKIAFEGKLGLDLDDEQGYAAARLCALNALAQVHDATRDLEKIRRIVKIDGYVHAVEGYRGHPQVLNGASDLINALFGDRGKHARLAIGVHAMPLNAAVQICLTAEVDV